MVFAIIAWGAGILTDDHYVGLKLLIKRISKYIYVYIHISNSGTIETLICISTQVG